MDIKFNYCPILGLKEWSITPEPVYFKPRANPKSIHAENRNKVQRFLIAVLKNAIENRWIKKCD